MCPGMDDLYQYNCSGRGAGKNGGCNLDSKGQPFCECVPGYTGDACDVPNQVT